MNRLNIFLFGALAAAASACGGVAGDSLFNGPGAGGSGGALTTSASSTQSASSGPTTAVSSGGSTVASTSAGTTASSSGTTTTSVASSSSTTTSVASSSSTSTTSSTSTSSGTTLPPVNCADGTCAAGEVCCFDATSTNPPDHCGKHGQCGQSFIELTCSVPEDCPGQICCARGTVVGMGPSQTFQYAGVSCQPTCANTTTYVEFALCSTTDPNVCPTGQQCTQSQVLGNNYYVCE